MTVPSLDPEIVVAMINVCERSPAAMLESVCAVLKTTDQAASVSKVTGRLPITVNSDLYFSVQALLSKAVGRISWANLGWCLETATIVQEQNKQSQSAELLWSGPAPDASVSARRIDQVLYDLIANANTDVILVTFAAAKIDRLVAALKRAAQRGVSMKLILEFESESQGQLTRDAIRAFPDELVNAAEIYYWPFDQRERNAYNKPGKLHAKTAVVDDAALVTSANLTDDAFNRNLELGVLFRGGEIPKTIRAHLGGLISSGVLRRWDGQF